jgi:2-oxoglutarate ferredoxin oxidoreductase subunit alpha
MSKNNADIRDELSVVLCGEAGQGIKTIEHFLIHLLKRKGYCVFATKEYMSRIRGGSNSTEIRIGQHPVASYTSRIDLLIPLHDKAITHLKNRIGPDTLVAGAPEILDPAQEQALLQEDQCAAVSFADIAREAGSKLYANSAAAGLVLGILGIATEDIESFLKEQFAGKADKIQQGNINAAKEGYKAGRKLVEEQRLSFRISPEPVHAEDLLLNGAEAVGLGAVAGGCNFIGSYPMSPSTGVLVFLANHAHEFGIAVEQVEDEIAAINMGLGAWFAGARAMVTTSGGGFALMCEGVSLAGIIESPMVIHVAQRPGPATGLPTRTEQGDLEMATYAGHGEFARIVLAPGSIEQAFALTQKAFEMADALQVPVVLLTDQFLMDSYCTVKALELPDQPPEHHIIETDEQYQRFALTENGLSPRGIPGYGRGLVSLDSDEHDEAGHITEDLVLRNRMVEKRLKRFELIAASSIAPDWIGPEDAPNLVVAWGSTLHTVGEAIQRLGRNDIALLHFQQVYPLPPGSADLLKRARKRVVVENNATGQFGKLLKLHTDIQTDRCLLKYNGMPFAVEEVEQALQNEFSKED